MLKSAREEDVKLDSVSSSHNVQWEVVHHVTGDEAARKLKLPGSLVVCHCSEDPVGHAGTWL